MDIVVTTPKREIENSKKEGKYVKENGGSWFRAMYYKPDCNPGDKIYFVEDGAIRGYGIIFKIEETKSQTCEVTGKEWKGKYFIHYHKWKWLKEEIPLKGFQGFRYFKNIKSNLN